MRQHLPEWADDLRVAQKQALSELSNSSHNINFLQAPTGAGKSLIAEMVRHSAGHRGIYTCTTKTLQDQVLRDFPEAAVLKGRGNYPTLTGPKWVTGDDCDMPLQGGPCSYCNPTYACPYRAAKRDAIRADLAVLNTSYLLRESNGGGHLKKDRDIVVIDEADLLEDELLSYVELGIPKKLYKEAGKPKWVSLGNSTSDAERNRAEWARWMGEDLAPVIGKRIEALEWKADTDPKARREMRRLQELLEKARTLYDNGMDGWVFTGYKDKEKFSRPTFKPISVAPYAKDVLWRHAPRWMLMSATIISAEQMARDLGLDRGHWGLVDVESDYDPRRRPVVVRGSESGGRANAEAALQDQQGELRRVLEQHPRERILVHSVSFARAGALADAVSGRPVFRYTDSSGRGVALSEWLQSSDGALFAPSFDRGLDLAHDLCRVSVIAKIPFPSLGDAQVSARLHTPGGQGWYDVKTIRTIVQMAGRTMRGPTDHSITYIIDGGFKTFHAKHRRLFPQYFNDALIWNETTAIGRRKLADYEEIKRESENAV